MSRPGSKVTQEIDRGTRTVDGIEVRITELRWNETPGVSFEVHRVGDGVDLTQDGCFDTAPTDGQIQALLDGELQRRLAALIDDGLRFGQCVQVFAGRQDDDARAIVAEAKAQYHDEGSIEVDDNAIVSEAERGDYVLAWVWVDAPVKTWTFFGHWEDDRIVVEFSVEGEVEDEREDDGRWEQGLWAASASGTTEDEAQESAVGEYESEEE